MRHIVRDEHDEQMNRLCKSDGSNMSAQPTSAADDVEWQEMTDWMNEWMNDRNLYSALTSVQMYAWSTALSREQKTRTKPTSERKTVWPRVHEISLVYLWWHAIAYKICDRNSEPAKVKKSKNLYILLYNRRTINAAVIWWYDMIGRLVKAY